ncbi:MAG: hypothetical protein HN742_41880 [Lentisphaerae bacterium]|jgi:hypothetical protein|nr:hypothetical protein [Lentisphaerota bacterium]MBT4818859.1 hypothetical protein [Lentisphaerota bacterium]MBT5608858.1 hypothetical protein [Lentisphaerota bacterium]MBT7057016.1 hypothetical protein [Lentisphaerota bacterium]MBT7848488.1 hypothetical protein [Lentisphaerota bacterium]
MTATPRSLLLCIGWLPALLLGGQPPVPELSQSVPVQTEPREVEAGDAWGRQVEIPACTAGQCPVLKLRVYARAGGGCNYVLKVLVDGIPLSETPLKRRLLNKLPWFDPPNTEYHFSWYDARASKWMTMFGQAEPITWGGTGRDTEFLFDLSGLVTPGKMARIEFRHAMPSLPAAIKRDRAPLVVCEAKVGVLEGGEVSRLRALVQDTANRYAIPVRSELPADAVPSSRYYELEWSQREESPPAQVAFEDLAGWRGTAGRGCEASVEASVERLAWRNQLAKLEYVSPDRPATVFLQPPTPVIIDKLFDAASMWLYADFDRMKDRHPQVSAHLEDAAGRDFSVDLGSVHNSHWVLLHGVLPRVLRGQLRFPVRFLGVSLSVGPVKEKRRLYLESIAFYQRNREPFTENTRPAEPTFPFPGVGSLPSAPDGVTVSSARDAGVVHFTSVSATGTLSYRIRPDQGVLNGISAKWNDGPWFEPTAGGQLKLELLPAVPVATPANVASAEMRDGTLLVRWERGAEWSAEYVLRGRTLVVDVVCRGGTAEGIRFGRVRGLPDARPVEVPYLRYGMGYCTPVACGNGLFVSVLPDWYHSDCSVVNGSVPKHEDGVGLMLGTDYLPLTDGRRNDLRERVMVTVSPEFAEVLPSIPHPPSPHMARLAPYMFCMVGYIRPAFLKTLKRYGIDQVITCDFARFYVQEFPAGFAGRWRPHPSLSLDQIRDYRRTIKDLGYLFGAYGDIRDWFPLNGFWDENCVSLDSQGDLVEGWYGNFRTKPNYLPVMARLVGEKVKEHYPPDSVYMDTQTCVGLKACDYEVGVPGAGVARDQVLFNADCIVKTKDYYGTVMSEAAYRWLYAGVADMDYGSLFMGRPANSIPPLVDFDLLKIHPLNLGTMMGYGPSIFFERGSEDLRAVYRDRGAGTGPEEFYRYVSASLAYGHMLMTGYSYLPPLSRMIHLYALMQGIQTEYLLDTAAEIAYHDGTTFVSTSQALLNDTQKLGRVRVRYSRGLTVTVNYSETAWHVDGYELPPFGWLISKPESILAFSALLDGRRVDYVRCPDYIYLNTGEQMAAVEALEAQGAVWLKREGAAWRLIPCGDLGPWETFPPPGFPEFQRDMRLRAVPSDRGCGPISIDTRESLRKKASEIKVEARGKLGGFAAESPGITVKDGRLVITPSTDVIDYLLR